MFRLFSIIGSIYACNYISISAFKEEPGLYNTIVAIEWEKNGLQEFQQWVGQLLEFPIY